VGQSCAPADAFALQVAVRDGEHAYTDIYFSASEEDEQGYRFAGQECDSPLYFARHQATHPPEVEAPKGARSTLPAEERLQM
jgi:hypothetical protein